MCCKSRSSCAYLKRPGCAVRTNTNGISVFERLNGKSHENIGRTDDFGTWSRGCAVKTNTNDMSVLSRLR